MISTEAPLSDNIQKTPSKMNSIVQEILEASNGIIADADDGILWWPMFMVAYDSVNK
jgi:hypothetical protein